MAVADTTKPVLTSLSFPTTVDVTSGGKNITFTASATDIGLGVNLVSVHFSKSWQNGSSNASLLFTYDSNDSFSDGKSSRDFFIDSSSAAGTYAIDYVYVYDKAGNYTTYYASDLALMGIATGFEIESTSAPDTTKPVLTSLNFPTTVDVTSGGKNITFTASATDIGLGVNLVSVSFSRSWQNGSSNASLLFTYDSNDSFSDGKSSKDFFIDSTSAAGTYAIDYVYVYDKAGNYTAYYASDLAAMGIATSFEIESASATDTTKPVLTSLSFPTTVDVTSGGKNITFTAGATDIGLGVNLVSVSFSRSWQNGSGNASLLFTYDSNDSFSDGKSSRDFFIDSSSAAGTYAIDYVYVYDKAGNYTAYYASDLASMGIANSFEIVDRKAGITASISSLSAISEGGTASFSPTLTLHAVSSYTGTVSLAFDATNSTISLKDADVPSFTGSYSVSQSPAGDYVINLPTISIVDDLAIEGDEVLAFKVTASGQIFDSGSDNSIVKVMIKDNDRYGTDADDIMTGDAGNNYFVGRSGADILNGMDGGDRLEGGIGNDRLDGGAGDDRVLGGDGNDTIVGGDGRDVLYGDAGSDTIEGGAGTDFLYGGAGTDSLSYDSATAGVVVSLSLTSAQNTWGAGTDTVTGFENIRGSAFDDRLTGDGARNIINGLDGADVMIGLGGDDSYYVDDAGDKVVEKAGGGYDSVIASVDYTLGAQVEALTLGGRSHIDAAGNSLDNLLTGNAGKNRLNGGAGADRMVGKGGDDIYYVDNIGDVIVEQGGEGRDLVVTSIDFDLRGTNVENLRMTGTLNLQASGDAGANEIRGNDGYNIIRGDGGDDVLTGGGAVDLFMFDTTPGVGNVDRITDFAIFYDRIVLNPLIFSTAGPMGRLAEGAFQTGTVATEADDRILYDGASGTLFYDADGNGAGAALPFAQLNAGTALTYWDIYVI